MGFWKDLGSGHIDRAFSNVTVGDIVGYALAPFSGGTSLLLTQAIGGEAWKAFKHWVIPDMRRDREAMSNSATTSRRIIYGRTRVSGAMVYAETSGDKDQTLNIVVVFAGHVIDSFDEIWFDDKLVATKTGAWVIEAPFTGSATIELHDGTQAVASPMMLAATHGGWTANHKLLGCAYAVIQMTYDEAKYAAGIPTVKAVIKGKKVYDPRTGLTAWGCNSALCIRDYMLLDVERGGMGCDISEIDDPTFIAAANICDQIIYIDGIAHYRYTLNGIVSLESTPTSIVKSMLTAMAGQALYSMGLWSIYAGAPSASVQTIDESWLNGGISFKTGSNKNDLINTAKGRFTNPNELWADTEFPSVPVGISSPPNSTYWNVVASPSAYVLTNTYSVGTYVVYASKAHVALQAVPANTPPTNTSYWNAVAVYSSSEEYSSGNIIEYSQVVYSAKITVPPGNPYLAEDLEELSADITLPFTTDQHEAQRLAMIVVLKSRFGTSLSYPCNKKAEKLKVMETVAINNTLLGWSEKLFRIMSWEHVVGGGVNLSLVEDNPAIWGDPTAYGVLTPPTMTNLPDPRTVAAPTSLTVTEELYTTVVIAATKSRLNLAWISAQASGTLYDIALDGTVIQTIGETSYTINDLTPGTYNVSVRAKNSLGAVSSWVTITKTAHGKNTPPADVTGFTAVFAGNIISLSWDTNTADDLAGYEIRTGSSWAAGVLLQRLLLNSYTYRPAGAGAVTYWVSAVDTAGNYSTAVSASVTVPTADTPTAITPTGQFLAIDLAIVHNTSRSDTDFVEVWAGTVNNRSSAAQVGITRNGRWQHQGLTNGATRYYWARCVTVFGQNGAWYPSGATSGVQATAIASPVDVLKLLNADITSPQVAAYLSNSTSLLTLMDTRPMLFELGVVGPGVAATYTDALSQAASQMNANQTLLQGLTATVSGLVTSDYSDLETYAPGQFVKYLGGIYQNILESTGILPTNPTYWSPTSDIITLVNDVRADLNTATGTWTQTATRLNARLDDLNVPEYSGATPYTAGSYVWYADPQYTYRCILDTTGNLPTNTTYWVSELKIGRVTAAETQITQNGEQIALTGEAIIGPLAFTAGVVEHGVQIESVADVKNLEMQVSRVGIYLDTAKSDILLTASRLDGVSGVLSQALIDIDGANAAITLRATKAELAGQVAILSDAISAKVSSADYAAELVILDNAISARVTHDNLGAEVALLPDIIGVKLFSDTASAGMVVEWSDVGHTKSKITMFSDRFFVSRPDGTGAVNIVTVGEIDGVSAVGISGALIVDGSISARAIDTDTLLIGSNIFMAPGATLSWGSISKSGAELSDVDWNAASKLSGIAEGATVGATWGNNLSSVPDNVNTAGASPTVSLLNSAITVGDDGKLTGIGTSGVVVDNRKITFAGLSDKPTYIESTKITGTRIESCGVYGNSIGTLGSRLTEACVVGDTVLYLDDTSAFDTSGNGFIIDSATIRVLPFSWTGKTAGSLTGCVVIRDRSQYSTVLPETKAIIIDKKANEILVFGDINDGSGRCANIASLGKNAGGTDSVFYIGGSNTYNFVGISILTGGIYGISSTGANSTASIYLRNANTGVDVSGLNYGIDTSSTGTALRAYGSGASAYAAYFRIRPDIGSTEAISPLRLQPSLSASAPAHTAGLGSLWLTSAGVLYINTSGSTTWQKVGSQ